MTQINELVQDTADDLSEYLIPGQKSTGDTAALSILRFAQPAQWRRVSADDGVLPGERILADTSANDVRLFMPVTNESQGSIIVKRTSLDFNLIISTGLAGLDDQFDTDGLLVDLRVEEFSFFSEQGCWQSHHRRLTYEAASDRGGGGGGS